MVKELRSVLAVRSLQKQKRREEKRSRKLLNDPLTPVESHVATDAKSHLRDSHVPDQPLPTKECTVGGKSLHVEGKDLGEIHVEAHIECKPIETCGTDVLENQRPSEASLHVQSDTLKFGTKDMLVQNPNEMYSEAAMMNVTTTHNESDCCCRGSERRNGTQSEGSESGGGDSGMVFAGGGRDCRTARAEDVGTMQEERGWDGRATAEAVAAAAVLSGRNREEIFEGSSESVDD